MKLWPALEIAAPDDLVHAALMDFDVAAIDDNAPESWRVFFHSFDARDRAAAALRNQFAGLTLLPVDVPDEDWAARSQANLTALQIGNIIVAPPWDVASVAQGFSPADSANPPITIIIEPSMGFGTGHHATTRLCLAHLQEIDLRNRTAIDVGTGSGVLAIAASRLGATHVLAIDNDSDAIESARRNIDLNPGADVTLGLVDLRRARLRAFDVLLGNLTGGMLIAAAHDLRTLTAAQGQLILSGFLLDEQDDVLTAFAGCRLEKRSQEDEWVCVTLVQPQ
jgi:ribosomal protein L11 methyltransferase